ncbi:MAG: Dabb family protein [Flavobacteriales bacterium]
MTQSIKTNNIQSQDSVLRHVVLFKFKEGTSKSDIATIEAAFNALPSKIKTIFSYEWGLNNSPEGLNKGFTHCYLLTFKTEEDRGIYLPHPDHKAFGTVLTPHLEDVLVVDYWTQ